MKLPFVKTRKNEDERLSWRELFNLYKQVKLPWVMLIVVGALTILFRQAALWVVPYTSKIQMGLITEHGFLAGYIFFTLFYAFIDDIQGAFNELTGQVTARNVRHTVWGKILSLPLSKVTGRNSQSLVSRVTQDTTGIYAAVAAIIQLISVIYGIVTAFQQMYLTYKSLALIMLSAIPVTLLTAWLLGKMQYKIEYITNTAMAKMTNFFAERLPNILRIKTTRMEDEEYEKGVAANQDRYKAEIKQEVIFIFTGPLGSLSQTLNQIVLLLVASALVRAGSMQQYQMVNLYNYFTLFMMNTFMISAVWQSVKKSHGTATTIAKLASAADEDLTSGEPVGVVSDIAACDLSFSYDGEKDVLDGVSFTIPAGKVTAIVGENGCGKSTLIKLIERFDREQAGELMLGGRALDDVNLRDWREHVGYLFQGNQIIQGTIRENIAFGVHREFTEDELIEAAKLARIYDAIRAKEDGFDTQISRFDNKVSGGEMQRIAIARVILKAPELLIMDEATSGIDVVSEHEVMEALMNLMRDKTVIMVSHDLNLISKADNLIVLNDGHVEAAGTYESVAATSPLMQSFISGATAA